MVSCPGDSTDILCYTEPEEEEEETAPTVIETDVTTVDTITTTDSLADFTLDYEPVVVTSIEEQVGEPDALIEDDPNFVDIKGVLSPE